MERGALVPRRHQPVGGQRGGQRTADHESEVPGTGGRDEARFGAGGQRVDHSRGVLAKFGQRAAERVADGGRIGTGGDGPLINGGKKRFRVCGGSAEAGGAIRHTLSSPFVQTADPWQ